MAGSKSDYLELAVLNHVLGGGDYTRPATVYIAAFTARGTDAQSDAGTNFTEVSGNAYTRVSITNNATNFPAAAAGAKSNGTAITFPTASGSWGTVTAVGMYDAASAGNLLYWGDLAASKAIASGETLSIQAGSFNFSED